MASGWFGSHHHRRPLCTSSRQQQNCDRRWGHDLQSLLGVLHRRPQSKKTKAKSRVALVVVECTKLEVAAVQQKKKIKALEERQQHSRVQQQRQQTKEEALGAAFESSLGLLQAQVRQLQMQAQAPQQSWQDALSRKSALIRNLDSTIGKLKRSASESEERWKVKVDTSVAKVENECSSKYSELHRKCLQSGRLCKQHWDNASRLSDEVCSLEEKNLELKAVVKQVRCKATKCETKLQKLQTELDAAQKRVTGANFKAAASKLVDAVFRGAKDLFANHLDKLKYHPLFQGPGMKPRTGSTRKNFAETSGNLHMWV